MSNNQNMAAQEHYKSDLGNPLERKTWLILSLLFRLKFWNFIAPIPLDSGWFHRLKYLWIINEFLNINYELFLLARVILLSLLLSLQQMVDIRLVFVFWT